jgi:hypothetical protein
MRFRDAKKLHNGDEVIDKTSKESVKVLSITEEQIVPGQQAVMIEGIGTRQGYNHWQHTMVR